MEPAADNPDRSPTPILEYHTVMPPRLTGFLYFRVMLAASIRLIAASFLILAGLTLFVIGVIGLFGPGNMDAACIGVVWGPMMSGVGVIWFSRTFKILSWGRNYNPKY